MHCLNFEVLFFRCCRILYKFHFSSILEISYQRLYIMSFTSRKMLHKALYLFPLLAEVISATSFCTSYTPCKCIMDGGQIIDLTSVGTIGKPRFYQIRNENSSDLAFSYNPCYAFDSEDQHTGVKKGYKPCKNAAACARTPGGAEGEWPKEYAIGWQEGATFSTNEQLKTHINYTVPGPKNEQLLTVILTCGTGDKHHLDILESGEKNFYLMNLTSKCACPNGCTSKDPPQPDDTGLSTGSKLLIAFFTITLAYFIVGILWNLYNGAKGTELVPNVEFWNDLPKLIIEGISFVCSCGRRRAYADV